MVNGLGHFSHYLLQLRLLLISHLFVVISAFGQSYLEVNLSCLQAFLVLVKFSSELLVEFDDIVTDLTHFVFGILHILYTISDQSFALQLAAVNSRLDSVRDN